MLKAAKKHLEKHTKHFEVYKVFNDSLNSQKSEKLKDGITKHISFLLTIIDCWSISIVGVLLATLPLAMHHQ